MFAKLYETEKYGQIVVMLQSDEENDPEIRFFCKPPNLGVCSFACSYTDWQMAEEIFEGQVTQEMAEAAAEEVFGLSEGV